jgi:hypothetical protein
MMKPVTAWAILALLAASVVALPVFAPTVAASETIIAVKADRLDRIAVKGSCSKQVWPNLDASCLRNAGSSLPVNTARRVGAPASKQSASAI